MKNPLPDLASFFFPVFCPCCTGKVEGKGYFHDDCLNNLISLPQEIIETEFLRTFGAGSFLSDHFFLFYFDETTPSEKIIHAIKYKGRFRLARELGRILGANILTNKSLWKADMIIPVPLHPLKKSERGYNQAERISLGISDATGIPVNSKSLKRVKYTGTQTYLSMRRRKQNIKGAFELKKPESVKGKKIIVVDDVLTTGATIVECAKLLYAAGAESLFAASLAKTIKEF